MMTKFKVGDKVRLTKAGIKLITESSFGLDDVVIPKSIVIIEVDEWDYDLPYRVKFIDQLDSAWWLHAEDLSPLLNMRNK